MSELKDYNIMDIEAMDDERLEKSESGKIQVTRVYIKSEADKVIDFWKNESRHQKYKRCLAMAEMCNAMYDEEDAKVNGCGASWEYISKEMKYWERWRWRWLKIADKLKEAK